MSPAFPDEPADSFPRPPRSFADGAGRTIDVERASDADAADLLAMYREFDPADRAQGIPPVQDEAIEQWLDTILAEDCVNVVARYDGAAVGHATLVPDGDIGYELAIFVLSEYQGAGIGTELVETLLGLGQAEGIEKVWLTVERWNDPAIALYKTVGFETSDAERFELEMGIRI
ncbi:Acetyltransferase (GNAT) family protein [Halomicrobium zhouii]|uniref:Acetyltransferase (GNAT) family protein n=1 Tax=Halomicrobium zhouii TaxID=767519 RepID=A0A1I6MBH6_9EURY|nr:GNAT family N-acetyltransferase [Halomicrobium zhouii]SFS13054.1 Acetyltransferase (GNAT) family protein [Halomicrobium zhouii]